jgi:hypothetical protein
MKLGDYHWEMQGVYKLKTLGFGNVMKLEKMLQGRTNTIAHIKFS